MKQLLRLAAIACLGIAPLSAQAAPKPVALDTMRHMSATLTVIGGNGSETSYTPATLEEFPTYSLRTTTPWREEPAEFEGILLRDLLEANGLADAEAIAVTAENEYQVTIPRIIWQELDVLVATRVDGRQHSRRNRGPIQFVISADEYGTSPDAREDHLVWMAARIEAAR